MKRRVFGLNLVDGVPTGDTPVEVVVIAKCTDEDGCVSMWHSATHDLNTFEALGMVRWTELRLEQGLLEFDDDV